jgi:hypothetical protein
MEQPTSTPKDTNSTQQNSAKAISTTAQYGFQWLFEAFLGFILMFVVYYFIYHQNSSCSQR